LQAPSLKTRVQWSARISESVLIVVGIAVWRPYVSLTSGAEAVELESR
jgi:cellobiose-specific phosphotransferase system component IIC